MAEPTLDPIEQTPLRVQIADRLRSAIVTGRMRPGDTITEMALAEQLNVSRAPVREAIQDLENDGLVESLAYRSKRVKPLTVREVSEILEMRQQFEVLAVRRILANTVPLDDLWRACEAMEGAAADGDREALISADGTFHRTLIGLADHDLLSQLWNGLYLRIHQIMSLRNDADVDLNDIAGTHPPIIRALEQRQLDRAILLVSEHFAALADFDPSHIAARDE